MMQIVKFVWSMCETNVETQRQFFVPWMLYVKLYTFIGHDGSNNVRILNNTASLNLCI